MRFEQIEAIIADIKYKDWKIYLFQSPRLTIQVTWQDACVVTGNMMEQESRKWFLDAEEITEDYVVNTVFKAIQNAEEHEVKERFNYKGKRVFNPHVSIAKLLEVCGE